jgi:isopentenyldiphosphate isomerase
MTQIRDIADGVRVNDINDIYLYVFDGEADLGNATTDEVEQMRWMTKDEIQKLFKNGEVVSGIKDLSYFMKDNDSIF